MIAIIYLWCCVVLHHSATNIMIGRYLLLINNVLVYMLVYTYLYDYLLHINRRVAIKFNVFILYIMCTGLPAYLPTTLSPAPILYTFIQQTLNTVKRCTWAARHNLIYNRRINLMFLINEVSKSARLNSVDFNMHKHNAHKPRARHQQHPTPVLMHTHTSY